ncbi:helix-hairpin-helix domain-containing protein [Methylomarinum vadi]|uniref:helix-hairpin-helix domain-containing protein n=1 Tax=Methylomarinum vadi TaxID=438855 RepID=UPI0004DF157A|nr:helix-hairpin-helix domain-containing protein [Methylomarinum vadi]
MLTQNQKAILSRSQLTLTELDEKKLLHIASHPDRAEHLSDAELVEFLTIANALYRGGDAIVSDADYDFVFQAELKKRHPNHPFLHRVEPESAFTGKTVELPVHMLSTDKAYSLDEIKRWAARIEKAAEELGKSFPDLTFRVTPKLDGYAAYDDGAILYTRGDGRKGTDISRVFERGLKVANGGDRGLGAGEIVISKSYFQQRLANHFDNARNFQASVIKEKELEEHAEQAIRDQAAVFYPFALLPAWTGSWKQLSNDFEGIIQTIWHKLDYDVDGVILEITDPDLKEYMGATRHHHRWQIAYKENVETAEVEVLNVTPQTSRSGRITPVAELEPTRLSGALLSRATAHHYKMVQDKGIGPGAIIRLARSGEVIPKIEEVIMAVEPQIPEHCPSCGTELVWDNDYLICTNNLECPAQITHSLEHFFRVLKNNDGFGPATIKKLYQHDIRTVDAIYQLSVEQFEAMGFGPKQSQNLVEQLQRSRNEAIEDWRFLAAFGVFRMGLGNCEKLLPHYPLTDIFQLSEQDIVAVEGFAEKTATVVIKGLAKIKPLFDKLYRLGFNLESSTIDRSRDNQHPLAGKLVVFTGAMQHGSRDDMKKEAKALGAKVGSSVSGKTDYLVIGEKVGETKLNAARDKGVAILTERQYLDLIKS